MGDYDLTKFRSFNKPIETTFVIPENQYPGVSRQKTLGTSPIGNQLYRSMTIEKRLVVPRRSSVNFMHNVARDKRELQYDPETETGNLNKLGPGPGKYELAKSFVDANLTKNRFTFPKTMRNLTGNSKERRLPISYTSPDI